MNLKLIEQVAQTLAVKPKVLIADIRDMAWTWEGTMEDISQPSPRALLSTLRAITKSYLRGRGVRMGNYQGLMQHGRTLTFLMVSTIDYVAGDDVFESLHQAGIFSVKSVIDMAEKRKGKPNILDEVKRLLDGGE